MFCEFTNLAQKADTTKKEFDFFGIGIDSERGVLRIGGKMYKLISYEGDAEFDEYIDATVFVASTETIDNPEFQSVITDSEDKLLCGIRKDGSVYQCAIDDLTQTKINELSNTLNNEFSTKLQELSDKIDRNWVGVEYNEEEGQINAILGDDSKIKEVTVDEDGNIVFTQLIN